MPEHPLEAHLLWEAMEEALGEDPGVRWGRLNQHEREDNLEAQWGLVLYQVLRGLRARACGVPCDWIMGYSAGELSAHALSGAIPVKVLPRLVLTRARLMSSAIANAAHQPCLVLLSERLPPQARDRREASLYKHGLVLAIARSPGESIWGGMPEDLARFMEEANQAGWNARALPISVPSHTRYLANVEAEWTQLLSDTPFRAPEKKVLTGVDGTLIQDPVQVRASLSRQLVEALRWDLALQILAEHGVTKALDLGPGDDQTRLLEALVPDLRRIEI